jgi:hypothetical protein
MRTLLRGFTRALAATLVTTTFAASQGAAQQTVPARAAKPDTIPVVLTVEGGGSLGVYEGGMAWTLVELFRQQRRALEGNALDVSAEGHAFLTSLPRFVLAATSGASAGSINAFLASVNWCQAGPSVAPQQSDYWLAWVSTGIPQLLPAPHERTAEKAMFSRTHFDGFVLDSLHKRWKTASWQPKCSVEFGAAITRLFADEIPVGKIARARNQRWAGVVTLASGEGASGPQFKRPPVAAREFTRLGRVVELPFDEAGLVSRSDVETLIKASSGYPLAFAPLRVSYCDPVATKISCEKRDTLFVDGGVFDNGPILLGYGLGMAHQGINAPKGVRLLFITPDRRRHTRGMADAFAHASSDTTHPEGLHAGTILVSNMIPTARQYELQVTERILGMLNVADTTQTGWMARFDRVLQAATARHVEDSAYAASVSSHFASTMTRDSMLSSLAGLAACRLRHAGCTDSIGTDTSFLARLDSLVAQRARQQQIAQSSATMGVMVQGTIARTVTAGASSAGVSDGKFANDRYHPLAGEWMNGFGGLLGYPLRAYDFYVGIYDGLHLIADEVTCVQVTEEALHARCVQNGVAWMIDTAPIALSPSDRTLLRTLYEIEYTTGARPHPMRADSADTAHRLASAVAWSMATRMAPADAPGVSCADRGLSGGITCSTGMDSTLAALKHTDGMLDLMKDLTSQCDTPMAHPMACRSDDVFLGFLDNPSHAMNRLLGRMLSRLDETTPSGVSSKKGVVLMSAFYFSTNDRARVDLEMGDNSIPPHAGFWGDFMRAFPTTIGGFPGHGGVSADLFTPRYHINRSLVVSTPFRGVFGSSLGVRERHDAHLLLGITPRLEMKGGTLFSSYGLELGYWDASANRHLQPAVGLSHMNVGITGSLLAKKIRIGVATTPPFLRALGRGNPFVTVGLNDANGLLYWVGRLVK